MMKPISLTLIPQEVLDALSAEEKAEIEKIVGARHFPVEKLATTNRGLWYLALNEPIKYSLLQLPQLSDADVKELLVHDASRLDAYHALMWERREKQGIWEQLFSSSMAALGNPNLTTDTVQWILGTLVSTKDETITQVEVYDTIGYQLLDKWSPDEFNAAVLDELVRVFEEYGVSYLPKFKHYTRKAAQRTHQKHQDVNLRP